MMAAKQGQALPCLPFRLSIKPLPNETEPGSNLVASQSFPAHRRENKVTIFKIPGHAPGILTSNRASVRLWRARSPMQVLIVSSLLETKACRKDFFDTLKPAARELPDFVPSDLFRGDYRVCLAAFLAAFLASHCVTHREQEMSPVTLRQVRPMSKSRSTATMRPM